MKTILNLETNVEKFYYSASLRCLRKTSNYTLKRPNFMVMKKILIMKMDEDEENYDEDVNKQSMTIPE